MNENEEPDIIIARLMSILLNKLYLDKLEPKELIITLLEMSK